MADSATSERKIVLGVDASEHSQRAFDWYVKNLCNKETDYLLVIHAHECPSVSVPYASGSAYFDDVRYLMEKNAKQAKDLLEKFGAKCKQHGLNFKLYKEESNNPGEVICKLAKNENAQFVVMGSRGVGTLRRTFLGSVSHYCVHHTDIPLAVVPPPKN